jgi:hypothetical protein
MIGQVTKSIAAENTYSDSMAAKGAFTLTLSGTWSATVYLQRSFDGGVTWLDIGSYAANIEDYGNEPVPCHLRFGVKTGGYSSGTVVGALYR